MIGLILKDILIIKKQLRIYLFIVPIYLLLGYSQQSFNLYELMIVILFSLLCVTAIAYDERCHWDKYALAMPVDRKALVIGKYLFSVLSCTTACIAILIVRTVLFLLGKGGSLDLYAILLEFCISIVYISLILPPLMKFGVEKGRLIYLAGFAVVGGIAGVGMSIDAEAAVLNFAWALPCFAVLLLTGSVLLSIKIYKKKEIC